MNGSRRSRPGACGGGVRSQTQSLGRSRDETVMLTHKLVHFACLLGSFRVLPRYTHSSRQHITRRALRSLSLCSAARRHIAWPAAAADPAPSVQAHTRLQAARSRLHALRPSWCTPPANEDKASHVEGQGEIQGSPCLRRGVGSTFRQAAAARHGQSRAAGRRPHGRRRRGSPHGRGRRSAAGPGAFRRHPRHPVGPGAPGASRRPS